jgi:ABC-2 type transport system ATP-binding protein/lipopolysaccharide transport system ATP-binding protein
VLVNGRVSALLELGAGFHPELTGRENVRLNGAILGLSGKQISAAMGRIVDFADIGEFIDSPVKVYSSGMYVRLGFAVAVSMDPEILMVDEVIAVGDEEFQRKCFDYLHELRKRGSTVVLVTHSLGLIREMCDQAVWLEHGRIRALGPGGAVVDEYLGDVNDREMHAAHPSAGSVGSPATTERQGSGEIRLTSLEFLGGDGRPSPVLLAGAPCTFRLRYFAREAVQQAAFGMGFIHELGMTVAEPNSGRVGFWSVEPGEGYVDLVVDDLLLQPATYRVSVGIGYRGHNIDFVDRGFDLHVRSGANQEAGLMRLPGTWRPPVLVGSGRSETDAARRAVRAE